MSVPAGIENNDGGQGPQDTTTQNQQPENRAPYADYLDKLPEAYRPAVEPVFKEWESNWTRQSQQYTDRLNNYKQYDPILQQVPDAEVLQAAVQMAQYLNADPEGFFKSLAGNLGWELDDDEDPMSGVDPNDQESYSNAKLEALESGLSEMSELIKSQQENQEAERFYADTMQQLQQVEQDNGPLDYELVLTKAGETGDLEGAVKWYYEKFAPILQQQQQNSQQQQNGITPPAPLGGGGGTPSNRQELSQMTKQQRMEAVIATLNAANQAQQ